MPSPIRGILKPTISVVMPSFNCLQYLPRALSSIYIQQCDDLEILVADDASTDGSWDWLQEQAAGQPQLRPIRTEGVGPAVARNRCIAEARGEYAAFLDADDSWCPHKLATQLAFHREHPEVVFSFTDYRCISPQGEDLGGSFDYWQKFGRIAGKHSGYRLLDAAPAVLFAENPVGTSSVMARRDALQDAKGFDSALPSAEDWDLWLRLARDHRMVKLRGDGVLYRQHARQGHQVFREPDYRTELLRRAVRQWGLCSPDGQCLPRADYRRILYKYHVEYAIQALHADRLSAANRSLLRAWRVQPVSWRPLGYAVAATLFGWRPR